MFLGRRTHDHVACTDFPLGGALALHPAAAGRDDQPLAQRVGMPSRPGAGSNVTNAAETRDGSVAWNSGSIRTLPVKYSAGPLAEDCEPLRLSSIASNLSLYRQSRGLRPLVNLIPHAVRSPQRANDIAAASLVVLV